MTHSFENTYFIFLNVLIWILSKKKYGKYFWKPSRASIASPDIVAIWTLRYHKNLTVEPFEWRTNWLGVPVEWGYMSTVSVISSMSIVPSFRKNLLLHEGWLPKRARQFSDALASLPLMVVPGSLIDWSKLEICNPACLTVLAPSLSVGIFVWSVWSVWSPV